MEALPLRDIHLPEPIGWWPLALGWWGVLGLLVLTLAGIFWWRHKKNHPSSTPFKAALAELDRLEADDTMPAREKLQALSILLKRVAISIYPRPEVAGLYGEEWFRWLEQKMGKSSEFCQMWACLADAPYKPHPSNSHAHEAINACRFWLTNFSAPIGKAD